MKVSINAAIHNRNNIISENIVCLRISTFMFSLSLFFTIDLYSLNPLTDIAINAGINIIFWSTSDEIIKPIPFGNPKTVIIVDIV